MAKKKHIDKLLKAIEQLRTSQKQTDKQLRDLERFFDHFEEYRKHDLMGSIAGVGFPASVQRYAENKGLYLIHTTDEAALVVNRPGFKPKVWRYRRARV